MNNNPYNIRDLRTPADYAAKLHQLQREAVRLDQKKEALLNTAANPRYVVEAILDRKHVEDLIEKVQDQMLGMQILESLSS